MRIALTAVLFLCASVSVQAFDLSNLSVPKEQIYAGGPLKDEIPTLTDPVPVWGKRINFLGPEDRVLGVLIHGHARAYPIRMLNWHEVVNDVVGGQPIAVTYCPLSGTGMVFNALVDGERMDFGVSGLIYKSGVLFFDRKTESLWSQLKREAVSGHFQGKQLEWLPVVHTSWDEWSKRYPRTDVIGFNQRFERDYFKDPYAEYNKKPHLLFPIHHQDNRLKKKDWVAGIVIEGQARAYPFIRLPHQQVIEDEFAGQRLQIIYNGQAESIEIFDEENRLIPAVQAYWFAWSAFYPNTEVYP